MKDYVEKAREIRESKETHHNCAQAVLLSFAEEMGLEPEQCQLLGGNFGSGMGCGSACGVVTGAMMVLGSLGYSKGESVAFVREFTEKYGALNCPDLLRLSRERGEQASCHCDQLIFDVVEGIGNKLQACEQKETVEV